MVWHVQHRLALQVDGPPRRRGRLKRTEAVKINIKKCNLSEGLTQDRSEWRNKIDVANPNIVRTRL